ncbi:hypothetical protein [Streptomyces xanthochromogenes]|uniref:hypothetical protein n=1 Tax=Streptomyces xanthochromogenes TaxID=67384 RepID=UPI00341871A2
MSELDALPSVPSAEPPIPPEPDGTSETEADRLRAELAELRKERDVRARQDALDGLSQRFQYLTPGIAQALGDGIPVDRLDAVASVINQAMADALTPRGQGSGGLDPTGGDRSMTWDRLFSQARQNRAQGQGATVVGGLR